MPNTLQATTAASAPDTPIAGRLTPRHICRLAVLNGAIAAADSQRVQLAVRFVTLEVRLHGRKTSRGVLGQTLMTEGKR